MSSPLQEHPFAAYVRILGKGKSGTRALTRDEARTAFGMILRDEVEPLQLGAFLMLLRVKEETGEELAGFVQACRDEMDPARPLGLADLDWASYAGKKHQHPWYLLAILLLVQAGYRVFIHGSEGHTPGRLYTVQAMQALGLPVATDWSQARRQLQEQRLSYLPLARFCPPLDRIMGLKPVLGLRSPVNSFARMLNPLQAPHSIQSVFHPAYAALHLAADQLLAQHSSLVFKGDSGEVEVKPGADTRLYWLRGNEIGESLLPRQLSRRTPAVPEPRVAPLRALWRGEARDSYGLAATLGTAAAALLLLQPGLVAEQALEQAHELWRNRDAGTLPPCP
ncbi:glycosyl transferase family protein [Kineobactrum salinum]|uniref:Glycosyl transferase family protein n=1 Tax=Kineobactrum salinum TaxID=2708301 RepID=A0A6C0UBE9_9GAMM|nr:glycosyl transferase family protein [Kineobactrum salinum]QIB67384.1 glycosyl transferase family protein [Kineobactrum salinum]